MRGNRSSVCFAVQDVRTRLSRRASTSPAYASKLSRVPARISRACAEASFADRNASYIPSPESGSTRPAASPTSATAARRCEPLAVDTPLARAAAGHAGAVAELRAGGDRPLGQERVQPAPLRQLRERRRRPPADAARVADAHLEAIGDALDH